MFLPSLNYTQEAQILEVLFESTALTVAPLLLMESFMIGVFCACVPLGSYLIWTKSISRMPFILTLWIGLMAMITHWALSLWQIESILTGHSLGISPPEAPLDNATRSDAVDSAQYDADLVAEIQYGDSTEPWPFFFPLVTETVLLGFASSLFIVTTFSSFRSLRSHWRSCLHWIVPAMASLMYTASLVHWVVFLQLFALWTDANGTVRRPDLDDLAQPDPNLLRGLPVTLLALLSFNAIMSDSIVLWRMCVVWGKTLPVRAFAVMSLVATLGLNIANLVVEDHLFLHPTGPGVGLNKMRNTHDPELLGTYGETPIGLAAAFASLASNTCATLLVAIKAWRHRRQISRCLRTHTSRTFVVRVMELLVESGLVYTTIWTLYCISFFRTITSQTTAGANSDDYISGVTAAMHLDAAMAQITFIYPLMVFILVALDKIHQSRGPQTLRDKVLPQEMDFAVTVTFEVDVERSAAQSPGSARTIVEGKTKLQDAVKP
ncbi:hypothetical protein PENSPDRAFT_754676 [Peniophora sp. CONT]|nr:hypothetical protein PENSPDRAFT_754676 [Peniophora sp. CONT]